MSGSRKQVPRVSKRQIKFQILENREETNTGSWKRVPGTIARKASAIFQATIRKLKVFGYK